MMHISRKLKILKGKLRDFNRPAYSGIQNRVRIALDELKQAQ